MASPDLATDGVCDIDATGTQPPAVVAPLFRQRAVRRLLRNLQGVDRVLSRTASYRDERTLSRLERGTPFAAGAASLGGHQVRYTHPHSVAAQYRDIFQAESYRFESVDTAPRIIDCGANIGLASLYWKSLYPRSRITAFEPDRHLVEVMRANLAAAGIDDVEIVPAAVWTSDGQLSFVAQGAGGGRLGHGDVSVPTVRLSDRLDEHIDLLKVDIEGAEAAVFADCASSLANVDRVFVEFHSFAGKPQRFDTVIDSLTGAGYRVYVQTERCPQRPFLGPDSSHPMDMQLNIYALRA